MDTLYDHIFSEDGPAGRAYITESGERYVIDSYSINANSMQVWLGQTSQQVEILPHLHDRHVISLTRKDLEVLARTG